MRHFLDLPRELRDLIYMAIIKRERPRPALAHTSAMYTWLGSTSEKTSWEDRGCIFTPKRMPSACANVLSVNRQVNSEMKQAIDLARRKEVLFASIDCIVYEADRHYFNWLSLPLVHTSISNTPSEKVRSGWARKIPGLGRFLAAPRWIQGSNCKWTTTIEQLRIDIRFFQHDETGQGRFGTRSYRTSWVICEALNRMFESVPNQSQPRDARNELTIDTLILDVLPPCIPLKQGSPACRDSRCPHITPANADCTRVVIADLVDVWNKLWSSDEAKAHQYRHLLERIQRVRICVDGVLVRERELRLELERGQAERRRIAARVGW